MSKLEKLKDRARALEAKDARAAIDTWLEVLRAQDEEGDPNPDLGIFNRIGDLYLKVKDPGLAADYYDRAVDRYAELGFHNNAIAMCNKVLRNAPGRPTTYLKLANSTPPKVSPVKPSKTSSNTPSGCKRRARFSRLSRR